MSNSTLPKTIAKPARRAASREWKAIVAAHERPHAGRATWQLINSIGPYALLWYLIYLTLPVAWWLVIPEMLLASGFLVRIFIIFHDCGHFSFFKSPLANQIWGYLTGIITFSPFLQWKQEHDAHHSTTGNLDRRGIGDIWTMTVEEYRSSSSTQRLLYRLTRHPVVLFLLAPFFVFMFRHRLASRGSKPRVHASVWATNVGLALMGWGLASVFGWLPWLIIQASIMTLAGGAGFWLFYVQHQFENVYWDRSETWDYAKAALRGSSYYRLPKILQWFTGNIGFHHIHHLSHRIPNYNLERCHRSNSGFFSEVKTLSIRESLKSLRYRLWDENSKSLIGFDQLRATR